MAEWLKAYGAMLGITLSICVLCGQSLFAAGRNQQRIEVLEQRVGVIDQMRDDLVSTKTKVSAIEATLEGIGAKLDRLIERRP